jgi:hypothetical protein
VSHAVVDRIVEDQAVLLVGEEEAEELVPVTELPPGAGEGSWLLVRPGPPVAVVGADPEAEARQRHRIEERMERVRGRGAGRFGDRSSG